MRQSASIAQCITYRNGIISAFYERMDFVIYIQQTIFIYYAFVIYILRNSNAGKPIFNFGFN
jgi:hypothetical protein